MNRRIPLNPCDAMIFGHHRLTSRAGLGGNIPFMVVELQGDVAPGTVREALASVFRAHPATMAALRIAPFRLRPYWQLPGSIDTSADDASARALGYDDLRSFRDGDERFEALWQSRYSPDWNAHDGPQIRLEHYALPGRQTRLCLRWPHYLMDAEGAQWFLAELGAAATTRQDDVFDAHLSADDEAIDILMHQSFARRISLCRTALGSLREPAPYTVRGLTPEPPPPLAGYRALHRHWSADAFGRIDEMARRTTPAGPARFTRRLAAAVLRALHRICCERGVASDAYLTTIPMHVFRFAENPGRFARRPLVGNYLVTPTLIIEASRADKPDVLARDVHRQYERFVQSNGGLSQWALLWAASWVHPWTYARTIGPILGRTRYATGFSYYGEVQRPLRRLGDAVVTNIWGGGPTTVPPGWNPTFSRFNDSLNLSLTYSLPAVADATAQRYIDLIEEELFAES